jgi:hypothetical protein
MWACIPSIHTREKLYRAALAAATRCLGSASLSPESCEPGVLRMLFGSGTVVDHAARSERWTHDARQVDTVSQ